MTDFGQLERLSQYWECWLQQSPSADFFQHWSWASASAKAYCGEAKLIAPVVFEGLRPVGVLPLAQRGRQLAFLGSPESDYNDVICEPGAGAHTTEAALGALLNFPGDWDSAVLDNVAEGSELFVASRALPESLRKHVQATARLPSPTIRLGDNGTELLNKLMAKEQLKRYEKKLNKLGRVTLRHIESKAEARRHLPEFFKQHVARCAMNGRHSQFLQEERRRFYQMLIEESDLQSHLRFAVLELNGRPVAYHLGVQFNGKFTWYKPSFDVDYWEYCPGNVLLRNLLAYTRDAGLREFDFSIGDEEFKFRFANALKRNYVVYLERHPMRVGARFRRPIRSAIALGRQQTIAKGWLKRAASAVRGIQNLQHARRKDLWEAGQDRLRRIVQILWIREGILFFSGSADTTPDTQLEFAPVTLAGIASLAAEVQGGIDAKRLHDCRRRFKAGDAALLGKDASGQVVVVWVGHRQAVFVREIGSEYRLPVPEPIDIAYECWRGPELETCLVTPELMASIAKDWRRDLWLYCLRSRPECEGFVEAGFKLRLSVSYRRILHCSRITARDAETEIGAKGQIKL